MDNFQCITLFPYFFLTIYGKNLIKINVLQL